MKTKTTWLALALAAITGATAQDEKPEGKRHHPLPPAVLEKFDADKDGKLDEEERKAARAEMQAKREEARKKMLEEFDANDDGKLDEAERKAAHEAMKAKRAALVEKYDSDGDGKLSREEIKAARDAGEEFPVHPMGPPGRKGPHGEGRKRPGPPAGE
jgi:hypothetical protein